LRCRAACDPGKNLLPGASRRLTGNRERETRIELRARCASETPYSDSYSIANTNSNSDSKAIANANSNSDPNRDRDSNVYSDPYGYIHCDPDSDCHSYSNPYSHGDSACFAWRD